MDDERLGLSKTVAKQARTILITGQRQDDIEAPSTDTRAEVVLHKPLDIEALLSVTGRFTGC